MALAITAVALVYHVSARYENRSSYCRGMAFADLGGLTTNCRIKGPIGAPELVVLSSLARDYCIWGKVVDAQDGPFRTLRYGVRAKA